MKRKKVDMRVRVYRTKWYHNNSYKNRNLKYNFLHNEIIIQYKKSIYI